VKITITDDNDQTWEVISELSDKAVADAIGAAYSLSSMVRESIELWKRGQRIAAERADLARQRREAADEVIAELQAKEEDKANGLD
jgi:hypothetical protein